MSVEMQSEAMVFSDDTDEDLINYYIEWTEEAIVELGNFISQLDGTFKPDLQQSIYETAHNIKGMGTSFGFPLMTEAGASFCVYLRRLEESAADRSVAEAHLKSFRLILAKRMMGDGGQIGKELIGRLNQLVEHILNS